MVSDTAASHQHAVHMDPHGRVRIRTGIELFGEPEFPEIRLDRQVVDLEQLGLSEATTRLVERWLSLVRDGWDDDQAVLAGVLAAAAIARERKFSTPVELAMRYPGDGDWFGFDVRNPGDCE